MKSHAAVSLCLITALILYSAEPFRLGLVRHRPRLKLHAEEWKEADSANSNLWRSEENSEDQPDWQETLAKKSDGSYWTSFESSQDKADDNQSAVQSLYAGDSEEKETEAWLDTLASLSAQEVEFNIQEADRADKVRQMQEWGFSNQAISSTLGVAMDTSLEEKDDVAGMKMYREQSYLDDIDLEKVESHTTVEKDPETGEPERTKMVYVDEHTCIGCTNCASTAQSTFYMNPEHGRARVFQQWGDDEETIQIAIETCPVDCIHYIPYEELVRLEIDRRKQNINFKGRLVSVAENGGGLSHRVGGGPFRFTAPQKISGNMKPRCSNCPTRGCPTCPMYGVGENPVYQQKEQERKARIAKRRLQQQREADQRSAEL